MHQNFKTALATSLKSGILIVSEWKPDMELLYVDNVIIFTTFYFISYNKKGTKSSVRIQLENGSLFISS